MAFRWNNTTDDVLAEFPDKFVSKARHLCYRCGKPLCITTLVASKVRIIGKEEYNMRVKSKYMEICNKKNIILRNHIQLGTS